MSTETNLRVVQAIFGAFGAGDMPTLLSHLTEDVEWTLPGPASVPHAGTRHGHAGAREFFELLGTATEFTAFNIQELVASGETVVALGNEAYIVRATGRTVEQEFALRFAFRDGKVCRFLSYEDTAAVAAAFVG